MTRGFALAGILFSLSMTDLAAADAPYTKNVAVVLYDGVEVLDFAGPAEVLAVASGYGANDADGAFNVFTVSKTKKPIVSQGFIDIIPDYSIEDSPAPDILVLPGGSSRSVTDDPAFMAWVKASSERAEHILTVCTGAFIAGRAGLLEGVEATTWYNAVPRLAAAFPNTKVHPGRRFVDNDKIITTAGVSAGIDGSLHLVARTLGRYVADRTAEYMEYKWSPESLHSSQYVQLNPRLDARGRSIQQGEISLREGNGEHAAQIFRALVDKDQSDATGWLGLGLALHSLEKYEEAISANEKAARSDAARGVALLNMARQYALLGQRDKAIETAEKAVAAGLRTRWSYENEADFTTIRDDARFKALMSKL